MIASRGREQGDAEREATGSRSDGYRHCAKIEQVYAVGEDAEAGIRRDRILLHLGERVVRRRGRSNEDVDVAER